MNDLSNFISDSKQLFDLVKTKYPNAELLTNEEKQMIQNYKDTYKIIYKELPNTHQEYEDGKIFINVFTLADFYQKYAQFKSINADETDINAFDSTIQRILHEQKFD